MVFEEPTFDAPVVRYLAKGKPVFVSLKAYGDARGVRFFKVKLDASHVGYVAMIDVEVKSQTKYIDVDAVKKPGHKRAPAVAEKAERFDEEKEPRSPFVVSRYLGASFGLIDYADSIGGNEYRESTSFFGLKLDGPGLPLQTVTEANVLLHVGAPSFYGPYSAGTPAGYAILADFLLMLPMVSNEYAAGYILAGPLLSYSAWGVNPGGSNQNLTDLSVGLSLAIGAGVRYEGVAFRLEYKYMIADHTQKGLQAAVQVGF